QDFELFTKEVLAPVLDKHPGAAVTLVGRFPPLAALNCFGSRITRMAPNWDFETYLQHLAKADINIAAINPSIFNDCKSEIKWLEAGMFGIPSVLSRTA